MKSRIRSASQPRRRDAGITPYTNEWPAPSAPVDRGPGAVSACRVASRTSARQIASFAASPLRLLLRHPTHRSTETTPSVTSGSDTAYRSQANEKFLASRLLRSQIHRKKPKGKPMPRRTAQANALQIGGPFGGRACLRPAEQAMGLFIRPIGMARASTKIGFANLVYNMQRMVWPLKQPEVINPSIRRPMGRSRHPDAHKCSPSKSLLWYIGLIWLLRCRSNLFLKLENSVERRCGFNVAGSWKPNLFPILAFPHPAGMAASVLINARVRV